MNLVLTYLNLTNVNWLNDKLPPSPRPPDRPPDRHTDRHTDTQTDTQTDTNTQTHKHTDTHIQTHTLKHTNPICGEIIIFIYTYTGIRISVMLICISFQPKLVMCLNDKICN